MDKGDVYPEEGLFGKTQINFLLATEEIEGGCQRSFRIVSRGKKNQKKDEQMIAVKLILFMRIVI